tara:strand:- start:469 stop:648 length:180 start_codon:yes stop_codon:yes gene_type:complete
MREKISPNLNFQFCIRPDVSLSMILSSDTSFAVGGILNQDANRLKMGFKRRLPCQQDRP